MTHKYLYIEESSNMLSESSPIYIVMIGTNPQANRDYLFLTSNAVSHGHYFEIWSRQTANFVAKIFNSYPDAKSRIKKITARQLVKHIKQCTEVPFSKNQLRNTIHMQLTMDTYFRISSNINAKRNG